jgi:probable phosphoglycerate mutase
MTLFLLIRHGENEMITQGRLPGRLPGVHLNERGRAQAEALAARLKEAPLKAVYSSPLERAQETAAPLAQAHGLEVTLRPGLIETDCGDWAGRPLKQLRRLKLWKVVQTQASAFTFPGGESFAQSQQRMVAELEALLAQHDPKDVIACVAHADPIKLAAAHYLGLPLDNFQRLLVGTGSITALYLGAPANRLLALNYDISLTFSQT